MAVSDTNIQKVKMKPIATRAFHQAQNSEHLALKRDRGRIGHPQKFSLLLFLENTFDFIALFLWKVLFDWLFCCESTFLLFILFRQRGFSVVILLKAHS